MDKANKIELLSPVGTYDALLQAIHNGADAVYLGGNHFGARAYAGNFDDENLKKAIHLAHLYDVRVYVTVNTLITEENTNTFLEYIDKVVSFGADALIMQDLGMIDVVLNKYDIPVHASTQLNNTSKENALFLKSIGVERVVLARESTIDTIKNVSNTLETEVFIHGALCICYSGQCLFSAITMDRSGNEGKCAQNCRMKYRLLKDNEADSDYKYLLSPKDMCLAKNIPQLIDAGVSSLKIEGRMKSPQYVGYVTKIYRRIIDSYYDGKQSYLTNKDIDTLSRLFNRGYTTGYLNGISQDLMSIERPNHQGVTIGKVIGINKAKIKLQLTDTLNQGDGIKFEQSDTGFVCNKIYKKDNLVSGGKAGDVISLDNKSRTNIGDTLLLTKDSILMDNLSRYEQKKIPIDMKAIIKIGNPIELTLSDKKGRKAVITHGVAAQSKNKPITYDWIKESLSKLGNTPYTVNNIDISMDNNVFIPRSVINEARRIAVDKLNKIRTQKSYNTKTVQEDFNSPIQKKISYSCKVQNNSQYKLVKDYPFDRIYISDYTSYVNNKSDKRLYYALDSVNYSADYTNERLLIGSIGSLSAACNNTINADYLMNIRNSYALKSMYKKGIDCITLSPEVTISEAKTIVNEYNKRYDACPNIEYLVYGRIQLMITKHCAIGTPKCNKCKTHDYALEDIKGKVYPIVTDENCCNHIYSEKMDKINSIDILINANINGFRMDFIRLSDNDIISACKRVFGN